MNKFVRKTSGRNQSEFANEMMTDLQPLNQSNVRFNDASRQSLSISSAQKKVFKHQHKGS
jgi:hypothetical protein